MSLDSVAFPEQIRTYFMQTHDETADDERLTQIFKENGPAREEFIHWAKAHQSLVERTPRLYHALDLANTETDAWEDMAAMVHSVSLRMRDNGCVDLINKVLSGQSNVNLGSVPDNYASTALDLYEAGIIDKQQVLKLFSQRLYHDLLPLMQKKVLKAALPQLALLAEKDPDFLAQILAVYNGFERTVLHFPNTFEIALPLLDKLNNEGLLKVFSFNIRMGNTILPVENALTCEEGRLLLDKIESVELFKILMEHDQEGNTPLHKVPLSEEILTFLFRKLGHNIDYIVGPLTAKNFKEEKPLHDIKKLKIVLPFFIEKLGAKETVNHFIKGRDYPNPSYLQSIEIFKESWPYLIKDKEINIVDLIQLSTMKDSKGEIPLRDPEVFDMVFPYFVEKLESKDLEMADIRLIANFLGEKTALYQPEIFAKTLIHLLSAMNQHGHTLHTLHNPEILVKILPFLIAKLDPDDLIEFFSAQDQDGNTPMLHHEIFIAAMPLLTEKLAAKAFTKLLSIQNEHGQMPLHRLLPNQHFPLLFERLGLKEFTNLLGVQNMNGDTLLHLLDLEKFKDGFDFLTEKLDVNEIFNLITVRGTNGVTPLFHPVRFKVPFLFLVKKLEPKAIVTLLTTPYNNNQVILQNSKIFAVAFSFLKENLDLDDFVKLLTTPFGDFEEMLLHNVDIFKIVFPYLTEKLDSKAIVELLVKPSEAMQYANPEIVKAAYTFFTTKADKEDIIKFFSTQLPSGFPPLHTIAILNTYFDFLLQKLGVEDFIKLFSVENKTFENRPGETPLEEEERFKLAISKIKQTNKFNSLDLFKLFTIKNSRGKTLLHNPSNLKEALSLIIPPPDFEGLPSIFFMSDEQLNELFSIKDNEGKTILDDLRNLAEAGSLLSHRNIPALQKYKLENIDMLEPRQVITLVLTQLNKPGTVLEEHVVDVFVESLESQLEHHNKNPKAAIELMQSMFTLIKTKNLPNHVENRVRGALLKFVENTVRKPDMTLEEAKVLIPLAKFIVSYYELLGLNNENDLVQEAAYLNTQVARTGQKNPFSLLEKLEAQSKEKIDFTPLPVEVEGNSVAFNMNTLGEISRGSKIDRPMLPPNATTENFDELFSSIELKKDEPEMREHLRKLDSTVPGMKIGANYLRGLLQLQDSNVSDPESNWRAVLSSILDKSNEPADGSYLTPQQEELLLVLSRIENCGPKKNEGIETAYHLLNPKYQYPVKITPWMSAEDRLEFEAHNAAMDFVREFAAEQSDKTEEEKAALLLNLVNDNQKILNDDQIEEQKQRLGSEYVPSAPLSSDIYLNIRENSGKVYRLVPPETREEEYWDIVDVKVQVGSKVETQTLTVLNANGALALLKAFEEEESRIKAENKAVEFVGTNAKLFMNAQFVTDDKILKQLIGLSLGVGQQLNQAVHQHTYLRNLIGHLVGASRGPRWDLYSECIYDELIKVTPQEALKVFFEHVTPDQLVDNLVSTVNENAEANSEILAPLLKDVWPEGAPFTRKEAIALLTHNKVGILAKEGA